MIFELLGRDSPDMRDRRLFPGLRTDSRKRADQCSFAGPVRNALLSFALCFPAGWQGNSAQLPPTLQLQVVPSPKISYRRVNKRFSRPITITVLDERDRPVPGADVTVVLPAKGAGASQNGQTRLDVQTNSDGIAQLNGLRANGTPGPYEIMVNASFSGKSVNASLSQENLKPRFVLRKSTFVLVGAAVAAAVLIPVLLRSPPQATISTVTPTGPVGKP